MPRLPRTPAPRSPRGATGVVTALAAALVAVLAACTGGTLDPPTAAPTPTATSRTPSVRAEVALPDAATTVVPGGTPAATAIAVSRAVFASAPVAVLAAQDDPAHVGPAATVGVALGAPVLVGGTDGADGAAAASRAVADELERLGTTDLVVVGDVPDDLPAGLRTHRVDPADPGAALAELGIAVGAEQVVDTGGSTEAAAALERPEPALLVGEVAPGTAPSPAPGASPGAASSPSSGSAPPGSGAGTDLSAAVAVPWPTLVPSSAPGSTPSPAPTRTTGPTPRATSDRAIADGGAAAASPDRPADLVRLGEDGPLVAPPEAPERAAVLVDLATDTRSAGAAAVATVRAAGIPVIDVPGGDPRATSGTVQALTGVRTVVALGTSFGDAQRLGPRVAAVATGVELPGGGQLVFPGTAPGKRYVALYGTPGTPALGVLGEQDVPATIARAEQTAAPYVDLTQDTVVPTLEIIATIASAGPEPDGSYSRPRSIEDLRPLVEAAGEAGMAVIIDLQPGRTDFVTQAQQFAELLEYPHVGLALDPEWRLAPDQVHLRQIGSVGIDEVNATAAWLAQFTRDRHLPQKIFLLHQFSLRMITDRERLDASHDELAMMIHADGQGSQPAKADTWRALHQGAPEVHWGWKNFYDEDTPMLDPAQTYAVQPVPDLVTYQ